MANPFQSVSGTDQRLGPDLVLKLNFRNLIESPFEKKKLQSYEYFGKSPPTDKYLLLFSPFGAKLKSGFIFKQASSTQ